MTIKDGIDWDDAFANMKHIPDAESYPERWSSLARVFRTQWSEKELDLSYGKHEREKMDLFFPLSSAKGLMIFIHGGYWMRLDKTFWSHLSRGALDRSLAVAIPSYTLTPDASISGITRQIAAAVIFASKKVEGPVYLVGHSAGGHLVTRMNCADSLLDQEIRNRLAGILSISGLHDLRPLRLTKLNETLNLTEQEAISESPILNTAVGKVPVVAWVGSNERPEFLRQTQLLNHHWPSCNSYFEGNDDHFTVLDGLETSQSALLTTFLGKLQAASDL